jgi:hypothetical protein
MQMTPRDKKILQVMGIVLPLLLLVYFLFLRPGGGEEVALPEFPTGATGGLPTDTPSATPSETPRETLPPVELAGARDPFSIPPGLELDTGGSVSPTSSGTVSPTVSPTGTGSPTLPPPTTPPPTTPPPTTPPPTSPPPTSPPPPPPDDVPGNKILIGGHDVKLASVAGNGKKAEVNVDGKLYTVEEGATFDDNFKLVKIDGKCAKFLFGDQSFELCLKKN